MLVAGGAQEPQMYTVTTTSAAPIHRFGALRVECPRFEGHLTAGARWALLGGSSAEVEAAVSAGVPA